MDEKVKELIDSIEVLKAKLSPGGEYSIHLTSGEVMGIGEAIEIGNVFERIDNALVALKGDPNGKEISQETTQENASQA